MLRLVLAVALLVLPAVVAGDGGETIETATEILALPYTDDGNTCDNMNDYDEACPWAGSTAKDVVYALTSPEDLLVDINVCAASYDTKLYVYAGGLDSLVACNDDGCAVTQSRILSLQLPSGSTYYIVVDGYGTACGAYALEVDALIPCIVDCPPGGQHEGEPPCQDEYVDSYNGGCDDNGWTTIQADENGCADICGRACTYVYQGAPLRDMDWYTATAAGGVVSARVEAEFPVLLVLIYDAHCGSLDFIDGFDQPCELIELEWDFEAEEEFWLVVTPTQFSGVPESDYLLHVCGIQSPPIPTVPTTWGRIKSTWR